MFWYTALKGECGAATTETVGGVVVWIETEGRYKTLETGTKCGVGNRTAAGSHGEAEKWCFWRSRNESKVVTEGGHWTEGGARNAGKRDKQNAFLVLKSFCPTNAKNCSGRRKLNVLASELSGGIKGADRGYHQVRLAKKGKESCAE